MHQSRQKSWTDVAIHRAATDMANMFTTDLGALGTFASFQQLGEKYALHSVTSLNVSR